LGYVYAVQTVTKKGTLSAPSAVVAVTTPPEAPAGVEAEVIKADEVRLSWSPADGATSYAVSVVADDGSETPATVLDIGERGATVRTQASTRYVFRVRGVAGELVSLGFATVEVTTPPREPSVVYLAVPRPVPDGHTVLTFHVEGTQTLQPTSGTLEVSINGGPTAQVAVVQSTAELPVDLTPGTYTVTMDYSGDGAFLPSSGQGTLYVARPLPTFTSDVIDRSSQVYAVKAADITCDSRTDLVAASYTADGLTPRLDVHPGRPDGTFAPVLTTALPGGQGASSLATGDLDRDGCADVAAVLGTELWIFRGSAAGLGSGTRVRGAGAVNTVALRDLTGDGLLDAVVGNGIGGGVSVLAGTGRGGFGRGPHDHRFAGALRRRRPRRRRPPRRRHRLPGRAARLGPVGRRAVPAALVQPAWAIPERHRGRGRHRRRPGGNHRRGPGRPGGHHRDLGRGRSAPSDGPCHPLATPRGDHRRHRR